MSHGDKIPDLVKDPEAEAEYEALKGLLEDDILRQLEKRGDEDGETVTTSHDQPGSRLVARKSTDPECRVKSRNVSRKSTGPHLRDWPETRIETPYSFYGEPSQPFDPKLIKTRMAMGGIEITLDAEKMGELINLEPTLVLEDCKNQL